MISFQDVVQHIAHNGILIDVRDEDECEQTGIIPTAHSIPLSQIEEAFELSENEFLEKYNFAKPNKHQEIILYCYSGARSHVAAKVLEKKGYLAKNYKGSIVDWKKRTN